MVGLYPPGSEPAGVGEHRDVSMLEVMCEAEDVELLADCEMMGCASDNGIFPCGHTSHTEEMSPPSVAQFPAATKPADPRRQVEETKATNGSLGAPLLTTASGAAGAWPARVAPPASAASSLLRPREPSNSSHPISETVPAAAPSARATVLQLSAEASVQQAAPLQQASVERQQDGTVVAGGGFAKASQTSNAALPASRQQAQAPQCTTSKEEGEDMSKREELGLGETQSDKPITPRGDKWRYGAPTQPLSPGSKTDSFIETKSQLGAEVHTSRRKMST